MYKRFIEGKKAVIFDLDGTVVDTKPLYIKAYKDVFAKLEIAPDAYVDLIGRGYHMADVLKKVEERLGGLPLSSNDLIDKVNSSFLHKLAGSGLEVKKGFWQLVYKLKEEKGLKIALVSNTKRDVGEQTLAYLGIKQAFEVTLYGDEVKHPKPSPEMYQKIIKKLKVRSKEVLSFEDSPAGAKAAVAAGTDLIVVWDCKTPEDKYPREALVFITEFLSLSYGLDQTVEEFIKDAASEAKAAASPES